MRCRTYERSPAFQAHIPEINSLRCFWRPADIIILFSEMCYFNFPVLCPSHRILWPPLQSMGSDSGNGKTRLSCPSFWPIIKNAHEASTFRQSAHLSTGRYWTWDVIPVWMTQMGVHGLNCAYEILYKAICRANVQSKCVAIGMHCS